MTLLAARAPTSAPCTRAGRLTVPVPYCRRARGRCGWLGARSGAVGSARDPAIWSDAIPPAIDCGPLRQFCFCAARFVQQTAICCSFRGVPRVHRCWASRFPRSQPRSDWATLGGARKLQQIAVCLRGRRLRVCETTFVQQQIGVRLRNALDAAAEWRLCCCETPLMLLRIDVNAAEERRWCWCGSTFMLMRSGADAAAGRYRCARFCMSGAWSAPPHAARLFASDISSAWSAIGATACGSPAIRLLCGAVFHLCASFKS